MTTVVFSRREFVMVADSQLTVSNAYKTLARKLNIVNGHMVGCAGDPVTAQRFLAWFRRKLSNPKLRPCEMAPRDEMEALVVAPDGKVNFYDERCIPMKETADFVAIGSGALAALAAMESGHRALEAVRIACKYDLYSSEPIQMLGRDKDGTGISYTARVA